jgi:hypothetical protein
MEVYLNSNVVYGAQAAAEHWYRKGFWSYTRKSCGIAAILPQKNMRQQVLRPTSTGKAKLFASCAP